jgi:hypothetical protein
MKRATEITTKLKRSAPELLQYVLGLERENAKLHTTIARLRVKHVSQQHEIAALKKMQPTQQIVLREVMYSDAQRKMNRSTQSNREDGGR